MGAIDHGMTTGGRPVLRVGVEPLAADRRAALAAGVVPGWYGGQLLAELELDRGHGPQGGA